MMQHLNDEDFARIIDLAGNGTLPGVEQSSQPAKVIEAVQIKAVVLKSATGIHTAAAEPGRIELLEAPHDSKLETENTQNWITVENVATMTIFYSVTENIGKDWRVGDIYVNGVPFKVIQKSAEP